MLLCDDTLKQKTVPLIHGLPCKCRSLYDVTKHVYMLTPRGFRN
jgi:hypothetical protein